MERRGGGGGGAVGGGGVCRWGNREIIYLSQHCHHQNDSCIKTGSNESHLHVSLTVRDSHKMVSTNHNLSDEKGEPKWNQALLLTSLMPHS